MIKDNFSYDWLDHKRWRIFFAFTKLEKSIQLHFILEDMGLYITYLGLFLYLLKLSVPQIPMLVLLFCTNMLLLLPRFGMYFGRYGVDFTAYLA